MVNKINITRLLNFLLVETLQMDLRNNEPRYLQSDEEEDDVSNGISNQGIPIHRKSSKINTLDKTGNFFFE